MKNRVAKYLSRTGQCRPLPAKDVDYKIGSPSNSSACLDERAFRFLMGNSNCTTSTPRQEGTYARTITQNQLTGISTQPNTSQTSMSSANNRMRNVASHYLDSLSLSLPPSSLNSANGLIPQPNRAELATTTTTITIAFITPWVHLRSVINRNGK